MDSTGPIQCRIVAMDKSSLFRRHRADTYYEEHTDSEDNFDESEQSTEKE